MRDGMTATLCVCPVGSFPSQHQRPLRKRMELIAVSDPMLAGAAGVGGQNKLDRHAVTGTQHAEHAVDRRRRRILSAFLDPHVSNVTTLILVGVFDVFQVGKAHAAAVRHAPAELRLVEFAAERRVDFLGALDGVFGRDRRPPQHDRIKVPAVTALLQRPFAEHAVRLAAATGSAEEHFRKRTAAQIVLRTALGRPTMITVVPDVRIESANCTVHRPVGPPARSRSHSSSDIGRSEMT